MRADNNQTLCRLCRWTNFKALISLLFSRLYLPIRKVLLYKPNIYRPHVKTAFEAAASKSRAEDIAALAGKGGNTAGAADYLLTSER